MSKITFKSVGSGSSEILFDGRIMNEEYDPTEMLRATCVRHGFTRHIRGYNQEGHDCVKFCLKCCDEIIQTLKEDSLL